MLIVLAFSMLSAQNLDSIINSSNRQLRHYRIQPLMSPDKLFKNQNIPNNDRFSHRFSAPSINEYTEIKEIEKEVQQLKSDVIKVTIILENMQKVNDKHGDRFDSIIKLIEIIITAIAGMITTMFGMYFNNKAKLIKEKHNKYGE